MGLPIAVALLALAVGAGCAKSATDAGVASAGGTAGAGGAGGTRRSPGPGAAGEVDVVKWAQCLRQQGLQVDDPDPDPNAGRTKPEFHTEGVPQGKVDAAIAACRQFNPNYGQPVQVDPAEEQRQYEFVKCMREHGIDLPTVDKTPGRPGPGQAPPTAPGGPTPAGEDFEQALKECNEKMPGVVVTDQPGGKK
jgi:hypothetical protein